MNPTMNPTANDDSILVDGFKPYKQDHLQDYIPTPTPAAAAAVSQWPKQVDVVDETTARRYCWGRMKKWQFILFCSVGGFLVFLALALAIVYLVSKNSWVRGGFFELINQLTLVISTTNQAVLPSILPKIFWDLIFKGDWTHLQIHSVAINRTTDTGFWTNIYMSK